jgi:hypothetical protein
MESSDLSSTPSTSSLEPETKTMAYNSSISKPAIYMNSELGRNLVDNRDNLIYSLIIWTQNNTKTWIGFVGVNQIRYPGYNAFTKIASNDLELENYWAATSNIKLDISL